MALRAMDCNSGVSGVSALRKQRMRQNSALQMEIGSICSNTNLLVGLKRTAFAPH